MSGNTFGKIFLVTTFGESHGPAIGAVIDGCPAGLELSESDIQIELDRRKPGQNSISSPRKEPDQLEILSGVFEGKTLGTPITLLIRNKDARPEDYAALKDTYRKGHAGETYALKYGHRDYRGGGRASGRETAARVAAGAIAKKLLTNAAGVKISGMVLSPNEEEIKAAQADGDSIGGRLTIKISGAPAGLGEPVFDKLEADLAKAMISIPAARAFELGAGTEFAKMRGSENLHNEGIFGGISSGEEINFTVTFKPPVSTKKSGIAGRHDPSVCHRALPVCEAMAALVLADHFLRNKNAKI